MRALGTRWWRSRDCCPDQAATGPGEASLALCRRRKERQSGQQPDPTDRWELPQRCRMQSREWHGVPAEKQRLPRPPKKREWVRLVYFPICKDLVQYSTKSSGKFCAMSQTSSGNLIREPDVPARSASHSCLVRGGRSLLQAAVWDRCSENALTPNGLLSDEAAAPSPSPAARAPGSLLHHWAWSCSPRSVNEARAGSGNS